MKPTATSDPRRGAKDAGFTLAEVLAGIFVIALLVSGFSELARRVAHTATSIRANVEDTRALRLAQSVFLELERTDPRAIEVASDHVTSRTGNALMTFQLSAEGDARTLEWMIDDGEAVPTGRTVRIAAARFEQEGGAVRLVDDANSVLLVAYPRRTAANCAFDAVLKSCR